MAWTCCAITLLAEKNMARKAQRKYSIYPNIEPMNQDRIGVTKMRANTPGTWATSGRLLSVCEGCK